MYLRCHPHYNISEFQARLASFYGLLRHACPTTSSCQRDIVADGLAWVPSATQPVTQQRCSLGLLYAVVHAY